MPPAVAKSQFIPPVPPPAARMAAPGKSSMQPQQVLGNYDMGDPTPEEQYILELMNRARANPPAEGNRFDTITDQMILIEFQNNPPPTQSQVKSEFQAYAAVPPLAFNKTLIAIARAHDQDMLTNGYQGHTGTDGTSPWDRMTNAGYTGWTNVGENVFDYGTSGWDIHASFECDFGNYNNTPPIGHRLNMINFDGNIFTEIGIGCVHGQKGSYGPIFTTEDFGTRSTHYITGVVYTDRNKNGMYDIGEGISGATITVSPAGQYTAVSSTSGGFAIPYTGSGSIKVTATSATGLGGAVVKTIQFDGTKNVKVDFTPDVATQVTLNEPGQNDTLLSSSSYTFTWNAITGATKYRIQIDTNSKFSTTPKMFLNDSTLSGVTTSRAVTGLKDGIRYYWRVQAKVAAGWAPYSPAQTFGVALAPTSVTLLSPADGAVIAPGAPIKFMWNEAAPRVVNYRLQIADDANLTNLILDDSTLSDVTDTFEVQGGSLFENGKHYYWTVSAENEIGWSAVAQPHSFIVTSAGVGDNAFAFDVKVSPNPASSQANIAFTLPDEQAVMIRIFNSLGQDVASENLGRLGTGAHSWTWHAKNLPAGSYYYELRSGDRLEAGRIQIVR